MIRIFFLEFCTASDFYQNVPQLGLRLQIIFDKSQPKNIENHKTENRVNPWCE